jgi:hypothetical protein
MNSLIQRFLTIVLVALLCGIPEAAIAQQGSSSQAPQSPSNQQPQVQPPIPGQPTMPPINRNQLPENPNPTPSNPVTPAPSPAPTQPTQNPTEPTGTAAAEALRPSGDAASRPAGAAIAPAKQHQVRSFLIKLGFVAGAGVAIGTVYALSTASPSRVPNTPH